MEDLLFLVNLFLLYCLLLGGGRGLLISLLHSEEFLTGSLLDAQVFGGLGGSFSAGGRFAGGGARGHGEAGGFSKGSWVSLQSFAASFSRLFGRIGSDRLL